MVMLAIDRHATPGSNASHGVIVGFLQVVETQDLLGVKLMRVRFFLCKVAFSGWGKQCVKAAARAKHARDLSGIP